MTTTWEISPDSKTIPTLHNPLFIEGLPGIGNVGKIATDFLIEEFKAKKGFSFFSHKFPNSVFVNEANLVEMPKIELYFKKFNDAKKRDLLLLTGDIQPIDEESCYTFCEEIIKVAQNFKCQEIVTTGGIGLQSIPEKPRVFVTSNDPQLLKEYTKKGLPVEEKIFGVVGPIMGVSGILLGLGKIRGMKAVSLLAETFGHPLFLGIKGAKELLRVLEAKFSLGININKMSKEIIEVEKELMKKTKEWAEEMTTAHAGAKAKKKEASYIG
ncbi:PAC2 family protein [Candidatus Woesearchaeota archaeon]|nr:PAC2 family protein [Candidatus Woesearchaeota archaeon]